MLRVQSINLNLCRGDAAHDIPTVLIERFDETFALRHRAVAATDRACVSSMNLASQRLCIALTHFKPYLLPDRISHLEIKLRSIADAIAKIRNQDVAIVALEKVALQTRSEFSKTAKRLIESRKQVRQNSSKKLKQLLLTLRPKALRKELFCLAVSESHNSSARLKSIAGGIIRRHLTQFEAHANPLLNPFSAATLKELSAVTKHLAFAIEIFGESSETDLRPFWRSLNAMDNALLEIAGCDSCVSHIQTEIVESIKAGHPNETRSLAPFLVAVKQQRKFHYEETYAIWNSWEKDQLSKCVRRAINTS